jgi:uncharacterized membrane-anchored protein
MDPESDNPAASPPSDPLTPAARLGAEGTGSRRLRKVPQLTAYFWIIKILTTAQGEATSDYLVHRLPPVTAVALGLAGLVIALALQFYVRRYVAWVYWLAVVMVAIAGTMAADVLHVRFGVPYAASTTGFALVLIVVFVAWYLSERTLSIHSIYTPRREAFYWCAVMAAFALGTAAGDLTATTLHLGYLVSGVMFAVLIAVPAVAYRLLGLNDVLAFWTAYVLTRPLGASFADWLDKPRPHGLGLGDGAITFTSTILIFCFVAYLAVSRKDVADDALPPSP